jgi:hypothetical protein
LCFFLDQLLEEGHAAQGVAEEAAGIGTGTGSEGRSVTTVKATSMQEQRQLTWLNNK